MKKIILPTIFISVVFCANAQFETGLSYSMAVPFKKMADNINLTHSAVGDIRYRFKKTKNLWMGTQLGLGVYATESQDQLYTFSNGSVTEAKVRFTSNIFNAHFITGVDLLNKPITPYLFGKAGLSNFYTKVYIPDPTDQGSCKPLENKNVYKDVTRREA